MLLKCVTAAAIAAVLNAAWAQQSQPATFQALSQINRLPWPHIGSPPSDDDPQPTKDRWRGESAAFDEAFRAIRGSWAGPEVTSPGELRARVEQYEALIKSVTGSAGYGNILLADCLRRLSLTLLATYEIRHPGDRPVGEVLRLERVSILDSAAMDWPTTNQRRPRAAPPANAASLGTNISSWHIHLIRLCGVIERSADCRLPSGLDERPALGPFLATGCSGVLQTAQNQLSYGVINQTIIGIGGLLQHVWWRDTRGIAPAAQDIFPRPGCGAADFVPPTPIQNQ